MLLPAGARATLCSEGGGHVPISPPISSAERSEKVVCRKARRPLSSCAGEKHESGFVCLTFEGRHRHRDTKGKGVDGCPLNGSWQ